MNQIINLVTNNKFFYDKLKGYTLLTPDILREIGIDNFKLGGYIKYIDNLNHLYSGGILVGIEGTKLTNFIFIIKSNIVFRLKYSKYYVFYKLKKK